MGQNRRERHDAYQLRWVLTFLRFHLSPLLLSMPSHQISALWYIYYGVHACLHHLPWLRVQTLHGWTGCYAPELHQHCGDGVYWWKG
ncbi:hypothetical protein F5146DRAFT_1124820 [Armillaria mellea]|nr:hypothetical protein F5146DRAFT_1124820 [Armillaria mellea]